MKKMIIIFMIIICCCGIGYLGYLIFKSKNIDKVELVGSMQTLYIVGDELDCQDAKLKVTYKNGNIKMIDVASDSVEVMYFTTSVETHGKMDIVYKSEVISVEYNVIQKGAYYLTDYFAKEHVPENGKPNQIDIVEESYTIDTTKEMFYISGNGVVNYYEKDAGKWFMIDGAYDKTYKYSIYGDTLTLTLGDDNYYITVDYLDSGKMTLVTEKLSGIENSKLITKQETKTFEHTNDMKTTQTVTDISVYYGKLSAGSSHVEFLKEETFESRNPDVYLAVVYKEYGANEHGVMHQFRTVYVKIHESMITKNFNTANKIDSVTHATVTYAGKSTDMAYTVI